MDGEEKKEKQDSFGIYLTSPRAKMELNPPLDSFALDGDPIISEKDIIEYDWETHTIKLTPGAGKRFHEQIKKIIRKPFIISLNGQKYYTGRFWTSESSRTLSIPIINLHPISEKQPPENCIRIDRAYPSEKFAKGEDPRNNKAIYECLEKLGKIKLTPAAFIQKNPEFMTGLLWNFSEKDKTFAAGSLTSSFSFSIKGKWKVIANGEIHLIGESFNTRSKKSEKIDTIIKNITIYEKTTFDKKEIPVVKIKCKDINIETLYKNSF